MRDVIEESAIRQVISDIYSAGVNGIYFVGAANYASREKEAVSNLDAVYREALKTLDAYIAKVGAGETAQQESLI